MQESVLSLSHVVKQYGDFTAVNDISLNIPKGSIYGFLGPNGAGKTTTIRMILDIINPRAAKLQSSVIPQRSMSALALAIYRKRRACIRR